MGFISFAESYIFLGEGGGVKLSPQSPFINHHYEIMDWSMNVLCDEKQQPTRHRIYMIYSSWPTWLAMKLKY